MNHTLLDNFTFLGEQNIANFPGFPNLYTVIFRIYNAEFRGKDYESDVNNYEKAAETPLKYLRVSYRLLKIATSREDLPIKLWSLLPDPGHSVIHAPFSGKDTMYAIFLRAFQEQLPIPAFLIGYNNAIITITEFGDLYSGINDKRRIWETLFDIPKIQKGLGDEYPKAFLGYGFKTNGNMISVLFQKNSESFTPLLKSEVQKQKRNQNLLNWEKGIYPLYKNPVGLSIESRIIGIDPGKYITLL